MEANDKNISNSNTCYIDVSVSEWKSILTNGDITTKDYKKTLLAFYDEPNHKASFEYLGLKYFFDTIGGQKFRAWISQLAQAVVKFIGQSTNSQTDTDEQKYLLVVMSPSKVLDSDEIQWTLRAELIQAIEDLGWNKRFSWIPFYTEFADKLLQFKDDRKELLDIVYSLDEKYVSYITGKDNDNRISDIDPFSVIAIFNRGLTDENRNIIARIFKDKFKISADIPSDYSGVSVLNSQKSVFFNKERVDTDVQPLWDFFVATLSGNNDEMRRQFDIVRKQHGVKWNLTMAMFWIRPYEYISLDSRNQLYLNKLGVEVFDESKFDSEHYFNLLEEVKLMMQTHKIKESSIPEISYNTWFNSEERRIWLLGYTYNSSDYQFDRFINDNIWQGIFMDAASSDQNLLKQAKMIKVGDIIALKSTGTKGTKHDKPFLRIKAVGVVCNDIESTKIEDATSCMCKVDYLSTDQHDFEGSSFGAFRKTLHLLDSKQKVIINYIDSIVNKNKEKQDTKPMENISSNGYRYYKYIELLKNNKNLVLTGAPGTGKTYMAKAIAKEMNAETIFVQFHPSYDYTDFVEGLRPVDNGNGQIGFERKDGVFKEFCREAINNLVDSSKSVKDLGEEFSWKERLQLFGEYAIDNGATKFQTSNGSEFTIKVITDRAIIVINEQNEKTSEISVSTDDILYILRNNIKLNNVRDIRNIFGRKYSTQSDSYAFVIVNEIRKHQPTEVESISSNVEKIAQKNYVVIIDEINRGEASKIFGELFYAIDPGYRGEKDMRVKTQYQNLVPESDIFSTGFYVPENVYILATMNDIDRSVESMDFAMRRRFTWQEVLPSDTDYMLDLLGKTLATEAKQKMYSLNRAISETEGLGTAYMIGPSYFLKLKDYDGDFKTLWRLNIEPLLKEYLRGFRKATEFLKTFESAYSNTGIIVDDDSKGEIDED
jgi:DNA polymerase III delta prime subunit